VSHISWSRVQKILKIRSLQSREKSRESCLLGRHDAHCFEKKEELEGFLNSRMFRKAKQLEDFKKR